MCLATSRWSSWTRPACRFYGAGGESLGAYGRSKDHRADLKQMILAVVIDGEGRGVLGDFAPSVTRQHCSKRNGQAIIREFSTSSTVIGVLKVARGFLPAHSRWTTETIASCSCVRP